MEFIDWVEGEKAATRGTMTILLYEPLRFLSTVCLFISLSSPGSFMVCTDSIWTVGLSHSQMINDPGDGIFCWVVKPFSDIYGVCLLQLGRIFFPRVRLQA